MDKSLEDLMRPNCAVRGCPEPPEFRVYGSNGRWLCLNHARLSAEKYYRVYGGGYKEGIPAPADLERIGVVEAPPPIDSFDVKKGGVKYDQDKLRWDLLPWDAIMEVAYVFTIGATKYLPRNWEQGMRWGRVFAATMRHVMDFIVKGEERDDESGAHHLAAAAFGILVLLAYSLRKIGTNDMPIFKMIDFQKLYKDHIDKVMASKKTYAADVEVQK